VPPRPKLVPLVFATIATQSAIVVLAPLVVEIGRDLGASVSAVGLARSIMAGTAVAVSLAIGPLIDRVGVRPLILSGAALAFAGAGAAAASPSLPAFYAAHLLTGGGVACLLSAGFAGVAAYFSGGEVAWAMGWVVGAQSISWIVGNPVIGLLADQGSWRLSYAVPATIAAVAFVAGLGAPRERPSMADEGDGTLAGLAAVFRDRSARRWTVAELVAYSAWTAELTYAGAFYVEKYGVSETAVGVLLSVGSVVFLVISVNFARITSGIPRRALIVGSAVAMGIVLIPVLNLTPSVGFTLGVFSVLALCAAVRSTGASALGLDQLPDRPGAMMGARTASAQLGYMVGAAAGGAVLALSDFGALGFVLCAGMLFSAVLIAGVTDPAEERPPRRREPVPQPVPD
jgi:predicted MFS family arabinose efflux permease